MKITHVFSGLVGAACILALIGLFWPYSYWGDELYSVAAAKQSLPRLLNAYVMPDVHPPLHPVLLHYWVNIFGPSEIATRALSLIASVGALVVFSTGVLKRFDRIHALIGIAVFSTSWLFPFYAQETRPYALLLFCSTALTLAAVDYAEHRKRLWRVLAWGLVTSLTHYFGLIYAGVVLLSLLYWCWPRPRALVSVCITGMACLVWPAIHYAAGSIGSYTGGNFWITSGGPETTVLRYAETLLSPVAEGLKAIGGPYIETAGVLAIVTAAFLALAWRVRNRPIPRYLLILVSSTIAIIIAIDLVSPISTTRNYIVLLPISSLLGIYLVQAFDTPGTRLGVIALCVANAGWAVFTIVDKTSPLENWKALPRLAKGDVYYSFSRVHPYGIDKERLAIYFNRPVRHVDPLKAMNRDKPFSVVLIDRERDAQTLEDQDSMRRVPLNQSSNRLVLFVSRPGS